MCLSSGQCFELEQLPEEERIVSTGDIIPLLVPGVKTGAVGSIGDTLAGLV